MHRSMIGARLTIPGHTTQTKQKTNNNRRYQKTIEHATHDAHRHIATHVVGILATAMQTEHKACWEIVWKATDFAQL